MLLRDDERAGAEMLDLARRTAELAATRMFALRRPEIREPLMDFIEMCRRELKCEADPETGRWYSTMFPRPVSKRSPILEESGTAPCYFCESAEADLLMADHAPGHTLPICARHISKAHRTMRWDGADVWTVKENA